MGYKILHIFTLRLPLNGQLEKSEILLCFFDASVVLFIRLSMLVRFSNSLSLFLLL